MAIIINSYNFLLDLNAVIHSIHKHVKQNCVNKIYKISVSFYLNDFNADDFSFVALQIVLMTTVL